MSAWLHWIRTNLLMLLIVYYALLALLAFNLTRLGELKSQQFSGAFVVGVFTTLGLGLAGYDNAWFPGGSVFVTRTYLGYLAVGGLGVGLAWMFAREMRHRGMITAVTAGLLFLTVASFGRAVWIAGAATFTVLAWRSGRRAQIVIAALVVGSALLLPGAQQEISSTESGDIAEAFRTGAIATGRWDLWTGLWERGTTALPWGNGFGYTWSLDSEDVLGVEGVFTTGESTLVPPHNDFLLLFIEFGVVGVFLLGWFWVAVIRAFFTRTARSDWRSALDGHVLLVLSHRPRYDVRGQSVQHPPVRRAILPGCRDHARTCVPGAITEHTRREAPRTVRGEFGSRKYARDRRTRIGIVSVGDARPQWRGSAIDGRGRGADVRSYSAGDRRRDLAPDVRGGRTIGMGRCEGPVADSRGTRSPVLADQVERRLTAGSSG